jgi:hypothetical protein
MLCAFYALFLGEIEEYVQSLSEVLRGQWLRL